MSEKSNNGNFIISIFISENVVSAHQNVQNNPYQFHIASDLFWT